MMFSAAGMDAGGTPTLSGHRSLGIEKGCGWWIGWFLFVVFQYVRHVSLTCHRRDQLTGTPIKMGLKPAF